MINLKVVENKVVPEPSKYLGVEFQSYNKAVKMVCSAVYDKQKMNPRTGRPTFVRWETELEGAPALAAALTDAGFEVALSQQLRNLLENVATKDQVKHESQLNTLMQVMPEGWTPKPHQVKGVAFLRSYNATCLIDDMGLGKTVQSIWAFLLERFPQVLIIAPKSVGDNWEKELRDQKVHETYKITRVKSKKNFRSPNEDEVIVTHYECMQMVDILPGTLLILDEVQLLKNLKFDSKGGVRGSQRALLGRSLSYFARAEGGACWGLTGTLIDKDPFDLLGVSLVVGFGDELFPRGNSSLYKAYQAEFKTVYIKGAGRKNVFDTWGEPQPSFVGKLAKFVLRRTKEVELNMAPVVFHDINLGPVVAEYQKTADEWWDQLEEVGGDAYKLPDFTEFSAVRKELSDMKIPKALAIAKEVTKPTLLISYHVDMVEAVGNLPGWGMIHGQTVNRQQVVDDFMSGKLIGVALTVRAGGLGLNLQRAVNVICTDLDYNPGKNDQAIDRSRRMGNDDPVTIFRMCWDHPLDRHLMMKIQVKQHLIDESIGKVALMQAATAANLLENNNNLSPKHDPPEPKENKYGQKTTINEIGVYKDKNNNIYKVKVNVSTGRLNVFKLQEGRYVYAKGMLSVLKHEDKLTLAEAQQYGHLYGQCIVCARPLSNEESIALGIGPICMKKYFGG